VTPSEPSDVVDWDEVLAQAIFVQHDARKHWPEGEARGFTPLAVSNGARASEVLGIRGADLDWGEQLVRVVRKGTQAEQWLPASPVWIRLYLADLATPVEPNQPLWQTLRRRDHGDGLRRHPMNYEALRAPM
jgi:integrase